MRNLATKRAKVVCDAKTGGGGREPKLKHKKKRGAQVSFGAPRESRATWQFHFAIYRGFWRAKELIEISLCVSWKLLVSPTPTPLITSCARTKLFFLILRRRCQFLALEGGGGIKLSLTAERSNIYCQFCNCTCTVLTVSLSLSFLFFLYTHSGFCFFSGCWLRAGNWPPQCARGGGIARKSCFQLLTLSKTYSPVFGHVWAQLRNCIYFFHI